MENFDGPNLGQGIGSAAPAVSDLLSDGSSLGGGSLVEGFPRSIIPFTLKVISNLRPSSQWGSTFYFHGMPVSTVRLLGRLQNRLDSDGYTSFVIDDGTGRVDARVKLVGIAYPRDLLIVKEGDYVIVNGALVYSGSDKYIDVYSFRCVTNFNDITHYFLLSIYALLDLKKRVEYRNFVVRNPLAISRIPPPSSTPPIKSDWLCLFDNVIRVFMQPGLSALENGATFALIQQKTGAWSEDLRSVIEAHLTLGNMFTTIDEDHYKCSLNGFVDNTSIKKGEQGEKMHMEVDGVQEELKTNVGHVENNSTSVENKC